ncbi:MAG TPA: mechanosensitive ion channel [Candidatus Saccharibacteria bacterium]|nr:mechanosensitive ion channel [Candidatus Saccharibacteria bacterium]
MLSDIIYKLEQSTTEVTQLAGAWIAQHLISIILILILGWIARKFLTKIISQLLRKTIRRDMYPTELDRKRRIKTIDGLITAVVRVGIWIIVITMIIGELGINTAPLIASAGVVGITLGIGAQSLIRDLVSGMFIIIENQFRIGDVVKLATINTPALEVSGIVEDITMRCTIIRDLNGELIHVPNGVINVTINKTVDYSQLNEDIIVQHDTDIEQLEHVINHVGKQLQDSVELGHLIIEAPHFERVVGFNNDGLQVKILGKTQPGEQWRISGEFYKKLKKTFDKNKIKIASQNNLAT